MMLCLAWITSATKLKNHRKYIHTAITFDRTTKVSICVVKKKLIISLLHYRILGRVFIQGKCILHWKIKKPYFFLADKRVPEKQRAREKTMNKIIAHVEMQRSTTKTRTERKNIYANTMFNTSSTTMEVLNGIYKIRAMPLFLYISTELFIIGYWCHDPD